MPSDITALARRWFEEVWNRRNVNAIGEMLAADGVIHGLGERPRAVRARGVPAFSRKVCWRVP